MKDPNNPCIFCSIRKNELIFENSLAYASRDSYPVTKFHSLVVPKRCIKNYFELNDKEILACDDLVKKLQQKISSEDSTVKGFNVGTNSGKVAGQSIFHCHIHVIPRREGDVENPQGGVRSVIPSKQHYIRKKITLLIIQNPNNGSISQLNYFFKYTTNITIYKFYVFN